MGGKDNKEKKRRCERTEGIEIKHVSDDIERVDVKAEKYLEHEKSGDFLSFTRFYKYII